MKNNREINQQVLNTSVDKKGRPTINLDKRKSIYESVTEALRAIPVTNRNVGLTIPIYNGVKVVEYWWEKGIKDSDFVKKIDSENIPRINSTLVSLQNQIDSISSFEFKVVLSLPEKGKSGIIYVVPAAEPTSTNIYDEYFWIESTQTYERWGGVDPEGDIAINNAFTFNENHFNIVEQYGIQNVSLKCNLLDVTSAGFDIYKLAVGEDDNERLIRLSRYSSTSTGMSSYGGRLILDGKKTTALDGTISYSSNLNNIDLTFNAIIDDETYSSILDCDKLKISDSISDITITKSEIKLTVDDDVKFRLNEDETIIDTDECFITVQGEHGFNISINDSYGIRAKEISDEDCVVIYNGRGSTIKVKPTSINFNTTDFYTPNLYLNDVQGNVNKGFIPYYINSYGVTLVGIKSTCDLWLENNSFNVKHNSNYSISKFTLNDIKYRKSTTPTSNGSSIISWYEGTNNYPELKLGWNQELQFKENIIYLAAFDSNCSVTSSVITLSHGDANCYIYNNGECGFYTSMNADIKILSNGDIKLKQLYNHIDVIDSDNVRKILIESGYDSYKGLVQLKAGSSYITINGGVDEDYEIRMYAANGVTIDGYNNGRIGIDSDGWCFIRGNVQSKMYVDGYSNTFVMVEEDEDWNIAKILLQQNANNYISLYRNSSSEDHLNIRTEYFTFRDGSNNVLFAIDSDGDSNWNLSNEFKWSLGNHKTVKIVATGIEYFDGTNTYSKTWAQIFS